ncbi:MAG: hypothetical protein IT356_13290, partial [Gemmatimonadaceae bacterium]|nr:hypothetical protein [Gemmatimonadaceae bacterium]
MPRLSKIAIVVALLSVAPYVKAGAILEVTQTPVEVSALRLHEDGQWMMGRDWGYDTLSVWMRERWQGGLGSYVQHANEIVVDPTRGGPVPTPIEFNKEVENESGLTWRAFQILLTPGPNSTLSNVSASIGNRAQFNNVSVVQFMNGTYSLVWNDP